MHDLLPLQMLPAGSCGQIGQLLGSADEVQRLQELGMRVGSQVEMIQGGSPCIVKLGNTKLCFRDNEAFGVLVQIDDAALGEVA
jgi:Fe2+ transport system protein FeoA